jgi:4-hydroxy-3-methylbut-2-enyl diphosphate reductase IspH
MSILRAVHRSSNNTHELVKTCAHYCARVHHVQTDEGVHPECFDAAKVVGLTVEARTRSVAGVAEGLR